MSFFPSYRQRATTTTSIGWTPFAIKSKSKSTKCASSRHGPPTCRPSRLYLPLGRPPAWTAGVSLMSCSGSWNQIIRSAPTAAKTLRTGAAAAYITPVMLNITVAVSLSFYSFTLSFCSVLSLPFCLSRFLSAYIWLHDRVSLNFCVVVCIDCCGVHRSLGTHVTKVQLLTFVIFIKICMHIWSAHK